jgi:demethylmenaquinone methyltransferase/2-methoxy-6-polyprenyl-1,4-benzoquinol methylase
MRKLYPESKVETPGSIARHYDILLDIATFGKYLPFIKQVISIANIKPDDRILDLGAGTGRNACLMAKYLSEKGELIGVDISKDMIAQFEKSCTDFPNVKIINRRIDKTLPYKNDFSKVFISFVLHGFPQNARKVIIENAFQSLKQNGEFLILDYNEFSLPDIPFYLRLAFKLMECPYAFDFIEKDWKKILESNNFAGFEEFFFFKNYVRLLKAKKINSNKEGRVRIAIPTNDEINIFPKMLGMAKYMFIYEIENGAKFRLIEKRNNPFAGTMQHLKTLDVYELINDCSVIISAHIGKKGITRLQERGMKIFFRKGNIQEVLIEVIKEF